MRAPRIDVALCECGQNVAAGALRLSRPSIQRIEAGALEKLRIGLELEELLGIEGAAPVLESLRCRPVRAFRAALERARREGRRS